jgi:hypothetical protein
MTPRVDPISMIVAALAAGAATAVSDAAGQAVKDAYAGLKALLLRRSASKEVIDGHADAPDVWDAPLRQQLDRAGVGEDEQIVQAAQRLLAIADPEGSKAGKYNVHISGGKGIVVGDHADVTMTFENDS